MSGFHVLTVCSLAATPITPLSPRLSPGPRASDGVRASRFLGSSGQLTRGVFSRHWPGHPSVPSVPSLDHALFLVTHTLASVTPTSLTLTCETRRSGAGGHPSPAAPQSPRGVSPCHARPRAPHPQSTLPPPPAPTPYRLSLHHSSGPGLTSACCSQMVFQDENCYHVTLIPKPVFSVPLKAKRLLVAPKSLCLTSASRALCL